MEPSTECCVILRLPWTHYISCLQHCFMLLQISKGKFTISLRFYIPTKSRMHEIRARVGSLGLASNQWGDWGPCWHPLGHPGAVHSPTLPLLLLLLVASCRGRQLAGRWGVGGERGGFFAGTQLGWLGACGLGAAPDLSIFPLVVNVHHSNSSLCWLVYLHIGLLLYRMPTTKSRKFFLHLA